MRQIVQKNGKNGTNIGRIRQKNGPHPGAYEYVCLRWSALRIGQGNVANTYLGNGLCYVLSIVSGKNRHIKETGKNR